MPVTVEWDNDEKTVIRYTFTDKWDWGDFWDSARESTRLSQTVTHTVDVIGDLTGTHIIPARGLQHLRTVTRIRPANRGVVYFYGANRFVYQMIDSMLRMAPNMTSDYNMVATAEDAYAAIAAARAKREETS